MDLNLIVAVDRNWAIGKNNKLMWSIPADMKFFRVPVINMGVGDHMDKLSRLHAAHLCEHVHKDRILTDIPTVYIVITGNKRYKVKEAAVVHSFEEAAEEAKKYEGDVFIIGGESVYRARILTDIPTVCRQHIVGALVQDRVQRQFVMSRLLRHITLAAPKFWLNPDVKDFYDFTADDVKLLDYETHEQIKGIPVAKDYSSDHKSLCLPDRTSPLYKNASRPSDSRKPSR